MDAIPHYGPRRFNFLGYRKILIADAGLALLSLIILLILFPNQVWLVLGGAAVANLPDLFWLLYIPQLEAGDKNGVDRLSRLHWTIQWKEFKGGIYVDVAWVALMWLLILLMK